jgi:hypothetical protein
LEDRFVVATPSEEGRLDLRYDFFTLPDELRVYRDEVRIFDTGLTNGSGAASVFFGPAYSSSEEVEIVVNEGGTGQPTSTWLYELKLISPYLRYQWRKDGEIIPGVTGATLLIPLLVADSGGQYTVIVSDRYGSVSSQTATVTVVPPPAPSLRALRRTAGQIQFSWDNPNFYLESSPQVDGPWNYLTGPATSFLFSPDDQNQFFRLREIYYSEK